MKRLASIMPTVPKIHLEEHKVHLEERKVHLEEHMQPSVAPAVGIPASSNGTCSAQTRPSDSAGTFVKLTLPTRQCDGVSKCYICWAPLQPGSGPSSIDC